MAGGGKYAANRKAIEAGRAMADAHPLVRSLPDMRVTWDGAALEQPQGAWLWAEGEICRYWQPSGWPYDPGAVVRPNLRRRAAPEEWAYVFARMRLHLVLGALDPARDRLSDHAAAWVTAERLIGGAGVGRRPADLPPVPEGLPRDEDTLRTALAARGDVPGDVAALSLALPGERFWTSGRVGAIPDALARQRLGDLAKGLRAIRRAWRGACAPPCRARRP